MVEIFFIVIEILVEKFGVDAATNSFKPIIVSTVIVELIMFLFCGVTLYLEEYYLTMLMILIMVGVYCFSKKRIQEVKEQIRGEQ